MPRTATWPWLLSIVIVAGFALFVRFDGLGEPSLWYDEILHVNLAREALEEPLSAWITGRIGDRENGPIYYATQLLAQQITSGEAAVRATPALLGTLAVLVMAGLGLAASGSRSVAFVAASLLALSPLHVYFSREGRPYAAVMLMASLLLLLLLLRDRSWAVPGAYLFSILTAYLAAAAIPVLLSFGALSILDWIFWRRTRSSSALHFAVASLIGCGLLILPTIDRLNASKPYPKMMITEPLSVAAADRLLGSLTVSGVDWATSRPMSFVLLALAFWGVVSLASRDRRRALHITGMFVLPIAGWLALLVVLDRWYVVRYTSAGLPAFLLLVALGLVSLIDTRWRRSSNDADQARSSRVPLFVVIAVVAGLSVSNWRAVRTEPWQKPDWRGLADLIHRLTVDNEPVIAQSKLSATSIRHYLDRAGHEIAVLNAGNELDEAKRLVKGREGAWVLSSGYSRAEDFRAWMKSLDPVVRSQLSNLSLYYYPDFPTFLTAPERTPALDQILEIETLIGNRHDFTGSELLLGTGWSFPETSGDGTHFRWAAGQTAEIGFLKSTPRDSILQLRLFPFPTSGKPPQTIEILLNHRPVMLLELSPGWKIYRVPIPAEFWRPGANLVTLRFGWLRSPADFDPDSVDSRSLAVAFDLAETIDAGLDADPRSEP